MFQKELILKKRINRKNVKFVIGFKYEPHLCSGCHDLVQKAVSFNNIVIVYVKGNAYRINFWYISKEDAINIMNNSSLIYKMGVL